jgi:hypothetical protein
LGSAKFIFDGNIVPNVHLKVLNNNQNNEFFGNYLLSLATTVNHYYNIEFIPYILKKDDTLRVHGPFDIVID